MSRRVLFAVALITLSASACAAEEQTSTQTTSSAPTTTSSDTTSAAPTPSGPVADILDATQVRPEDYHDMSFGGDSPESMTQSPQVAFITPSSNIACNWSPADPTGDLGLNCHAKERTSPPPDRPADCEYSWATDYVQLNPDGSVEDGVCTGGVLTPSIANTLPYGSALVDGEFGCMSAEAGVTCAHIPSGRGFLFSREKLTTF